MWYIDALTGHPHKCSCTSVSMPTALSSPLPAPCFAGKSTHTHILWSRAAAVAPWADDEGGLSNSRTHRHTTCQQLLSYCCTEIWSSSGWSCHWMRACLQLVHMNTLSVFIYICTNEFGVLLAHTLAFIRTGSVKSFVFLLTFESERLSR